MEKYFESTLNSTILPDPSVLSSLPVVSAGQSPSPLCSEIESATRGLRTNKAAGTDEIQTELLNVNCKTLDELYLNVVTAALKEGHFPSSW